MKRRKFLGFSLVFVVVIIFYLVIADRKKQIKPYPKDLALQIKNNPDIGFSVKCALLNGGYDIVKSITAKKWIRNDLGMVDVNGYLINKNEFDQFLTYLETKKGNDLK